MGLGVVDGALVDSTSVKALAASIERLVTVIDNDHPIAERNIKHALDLGERFLKSLDAIQRSIDAHRDELEEHRAEMRKTRIHT